MIEKTQFQNLIERMLREINMHSRAAVYLLLGTAAQESGFGTYLRQIGQPSIANQPAQERRAGPALGVFQMEPETAQDIWICYLGFREDLAVTVWQATGESCASERALESNIAYQIAMARIHYRRVSESLPPYNDIPALARYWKQHYNTPEGKGTEEEFVKNYQKYIPEVQK